MDLETGVVSILDTEICGSRECGEGFVCVKGVDNPIYGTVHFDNLLVSMITMFQSVTLEGWTSVMNCLQRSLGIYVSIFFIPVVFIGAFFFLNLTIIAMKASVIPTQFSRAMDEVKQRQHLRKELQEGCLVDDVISLTKQLMSPETQLMSPETLSEDLTFRNAQNLPLQGTLIVPEHFLLKKQGKKPVKMRQNSVSIHRNQRVIQAGSEGSLDISRNSIDGLLEKSDASGAWLAPASLTSSPSVSISSSIAPVGEAHYTSELSLSLYNCGDAILDENPEFTLVSHHSKDDNANKGIVCRFKIPSTERPLFDNSDSNSKSTDISQKNVVICVSEKWQLDVSSAADVQNRKESNEDTVRIAFLSGKEMSDMKRIQRWRRGRNSSALTKIFSTFRAMEMRITAKEAFRKLNPFSLRLKRSEKGQELEYDKFPYYCSNADVNPGRMPDSIISKSPLPYRLWSSGFKGSFERAIYPFKLISSNDRFGYFMTVCIVLNTFVLSINRYEIDPETQLYCDRFNNVFTAAFAIEMAIKLLGVGFRAYFREKMNIFDSLVVMLSMIELAFFSSSSVNALRAIRLIRIFRVLRVARLLRYMSYMRKIMSAINQSIEEFVYLGLLIFLFTYVFALFGMQLFAGKFSFHDADRSTYDGFNFAFLSTFQILTSENWPNILHNGMRAVGAPAAIYFIFWLFLGNFIMLNLFLAILLDVFSSISEEDEFIQSHLERNPTMLTGVEGSNRRVKRRLETIKKKIMDLEEESLDSGSNSIDSELKPIETRPMFVDVHCERSFFLFSKRSKIRVALYRLTSFPAFEWSVMVIIALSSLKLIWETYLLNEPAESVKVEISTQLDTVFTLLFTFEMVTKSITMGLVMDRGTYLRDPWYVLDAFIVVFSLVDMSVKGINLPIIKVFRLLRAVRPLRFISHNASMRIIVNALLESFSALLNVIVVVLIVWLIFAILGVSLFAGKMATCSVPDINEKWLCEYYSGQWVNAPYHFDDVVSAMTTLFDLTSPEDWNDTMYRAMDATGVDVAMERNENRYAGYYFVVFLVVSNFFFLNLFLGVVFDKFEKAKRENTSISELLLQNDQYRWIEVMKYVTATKHTPEIAIERTGFRLLLYRAVTHWSFDAVIIVCITANMVVMSIGYAEASAEYMQVLENIGVTFTVIFALEACVKMSSIGLQGYFKKPWNRFDFFAMLTSVLELCINSLLLSFAGSNPVILDYAKPLTKTLRVLRVARLFRLVKKLKLISDLVGILSVSLFAIVNVVSLLVLIFIVYGVLGVFLFSHVDSGQVINEYNNFSNFGMAAIALIRISTGEDWNYMLVDCAVSTNAWLTHVFFLTFVSITTFIMYNLFVMVMLQEYETYQTNPQSSFKLFKDHLRVFNFAWNRSSQESIRNKLSTESLLLFAYELGEDIGVTAGMSRFGVLRVLGCMGLTPDRSGFVYYHEALFKYMRVKFGLHNRSGSKVRKKILLREEGVYRRKIKELVRQDQMESASELIYGGFHRPDMQLAGLICLKSVFGSWKEWTKEHKEGSRISETPPRSNVYPGFNSPQDVDSPIIIVEPVPDKAPSRDLRVSRMSTSLSKNRTDVQD